MAKCELCKEKTEETFLNKLIGTYIKDKKGKRHIICRKCQKQHSKKEILEKL